MDMVRLLVEDGRCDVTLASRQGVTPLVAAENSGNVLIRDYLKVAEGRVTEPISVEEGQVVDASIEAEVTVDNRLTLG